MSVIKEIQQKLISRPQDVLQKTFSDRIKITTSFCPLNATSGDFISYHPLPDEKFLIVAGDTSGHDANAKFISAYFQGWLKGLVDKETLPEAICKKFNAFLAKEWNIVEGQHVILSVTTAFLIFDFKNQTLSALSNGFPLPNVYNSETPEKVDHITQSTPPLGWFDDLEFTIDSIPMPKSGSCYLWSNGLELHADALNISPQTLAYKLIQNQKLGLSDTTLLANQKDDVLAIEIQWPENHTLHQPLFYQTYKGDSEHCIDSFHKAWKISIQASIPNINNNKLNDILLAAREAVLNGLTHGCLRQHSKSCSIQIYLDQTNINNYLLIVYINDEGDGFDFNSIKDEVITTGEQTHISLGVIYA